MDCASGLRGLRGVAAVIALAPAMKADLASLSASARRLETIGAGAWTTETAIKRAREELASLERTIRQVRKGLPK